MKWMLSKNFMGSTRILFIALLASALLPGGAAAQTWDEFFSQGAKQKEYDKEGLTALSFGWARTVYIRNAIKYGFETYMNVEEGNLNLSRDFFGHLNNVSPEVANSAKVIDIIMFQYYLTRDMGKIWNFCSSGRNFTAQEIRYIEKVHANFLLLTDANITELIKIIAPGQTTMTDAERMEQIDRLHREQLDQQAFVKSFSDDVYFLSRERGKEQNRLGYSSQFYFTY